MLKKFSQSLGTENSTYIAFDDSSNLLQDDWLNAEERELECRTQQRKLKIQQAFHWMISSMNNSERGVRSISLSGTPTQTVQLPQLPQIELEAADSSEGEEVRNSEGVTMKLEDLDKEVNSGPRRSTRSTAGKFLSKRFIEEVFCSIISGSSVSSYCSQLMHLAKGNTDVNTGEDRISDPRVHAVKTIVPDMPILNEAVNWEFAKQYIEATKKEVSALILQNTQITVPQSEMIMLLSLHGLSN